MSRTVDWAGVERPVEQVVQTPNAATRWRFEVARGDRRRRNRRSTAC